MLGLRARAAPTALPSAPSDLQLAFHGAGRGGAEDQRRRVNAERWDGVGRRSRERQPSPDTVSTFHPLAEYHEAYGPQNRC